MRFIGVDPGQSGAIAWADDGGRVQVVKMPETECEVWDALYELLGVSEAGRYHTFAVIEAQHSFPGQGVSSTWKFAQGYGGLRMALIGLGIPFRAVAPARWQKALGCLTHSDKRISRARAQELMPYQKWTHATADAGLLVLYGQENHAALMGQEP